MGLGSVWENGPLAEVDLGVTSGNPSSYLAFGKGVSGPTKAEPCVAKIFGNGSARMPWSL